MPRTVEHIVECHRAAQALRKAGKPVWSMEVPMKAILRSGDLTSHEGISALGRDISAAFRKALPATLFDITNDNYDREIDEIIEDIESYSVEGLGLLAAERIDAKDMFNNRLDELYDWADRERIWLGA